MKKILAKLLVKLCIKENEEANIIDVSHNNMMYEVVMRPQRVCCSKTSDFGKHIRNWVIQKMKPPLEQIIVRLQGNCSSGY